MNKLFLALALATVLAITGCGGGGSPVVPPKDLTGLVGKWDVSLNVSGQFNGSGGSFYMNEDLAGIWVMDANTVRGVDAAGATLGYFTWTYDGETLKLFNDVSLSDFDPDCGVMTSSGKATFTIPIKRGAVHAPISGKAHLTVSSQFCGSIGGDAIYRGSMSKR
jgi:hypothetical protein